MRGDPLGSPVLGGGGEFVDEFVQGVGVHAGEGVAEFFGGGGLRGQAEDGAAAVAPGGGENAHDGGLPGAGRRQGELDAAAAGGDVADHRGLPVVELPAAVVGRPFQHRDLHVGVTDAHRVVAAGGADQALFGVQHRG